MRPRPPLVLVALALIGVTSGCAGPGQRAPTASLQPTTPPNAFACGAWMYAPPPRGRMLVDIDGGKPEAHADSLAARVRARGGEVVHVFHIPRVRARMDVGAATALRDWVFVVGDSSRHDVVVFASVRGPVSATDSAALVARGARLSGRLGLGRTYLYGVTLPDSVVPRLRAVPGVYAVQPMLVCRVSTDAARPL